MVPSFADATTCRFQDQFSLPPFAASVLAKALMLGFLVFQVPTLHRNQNPYPVRTSLRTLSWERPVQTHLPMRCVLEQSQMKSLLIEFEYWN